ncbi:ABC transporter permease, partial [Burkholderia pseudomallei]|nr:ABC transporter permease [Burkholderia pseudomallei]
MPSPPAPAAPAAALARRVPVPDWRGFVLPVAAFVLWWAVSSAHLVNSGLLVGPADVLRTAWAQATSGALTRALSASLAREACGFAIGATGGLLLGAALGLSRIAARVTGPSCDTFKQISLFALTSLLPVWFGLAHVAEVP